MTKKVFGTALAAVVLLAAFVLSSFVYPDVVSLQKTNPDMSAFMRYRERQWEREGRTLKIRHRYVPLAGISPYLVKAVIISEDDKFWRHEGFDLEAMQQALKKDIREKRFRAGGSTITQQLAKNLFLSPSKNPLRKLREAIYTWRLERCLTKRRIVELYLNYAEWGEGVFGIEAASRLYFGKHASMLGAREAARLAAVLPNPLRYSPTGASRYVARRSERIYRIMKARGIVIPEFVEVMTTPEEQGSTQEPEQESSSGVAPPEPEQAPHDAGAGLATFGGKAAGGIEGGSGTGDAPAVEPDPNGVQGE
jgi:monofunctional biosynthetic peptidoglycan transglycosylase